MITDHWASVRTKLMDLLLKLDFWIMLPLVPEATQTLVFCFFFKQRAIFGVNTCCRRWKGSSSDSVQDAAACQCQILLGLTFSWHAVRTKEWPLKCCENTIHWRATALTCDSRGFHCVKNKAESWIRSFNQNNHSLCSRDLISEWKSLLIHERFNSLKLRALLHQSTAESYHIKSSLDYRPF